MREGRTTSSRQWRWLVVFLVQDAAVPTTEYLASTKALVTALEQRATGFCVPLKPPWSREGGRAEERRTTLSHQRRWLGQANNGGSGDGRHARRHRPPRPLSPSSRLLPLPFLPLLFPRRGATRRCTPRQGKKAVPQPWPRQVPLRVSLPLPRRVEEATGHCCGHYGGGGRSPLLLLPPTEGPRGGGSGGGSCGASMVEGGKGGVVIVVLLFLWLGWWHNNWVDGQIGAPKKPGQNCPSQTMTVK